MTEAGPAHKNAVKSGRAYFKIVNHTTYVTGAVFFFVKQLPTMTGSCAVRRVTQTENLIWSLLDLGGQPSP